MSNALSCSWPGSVWEWMLLLYYSQVSFIPGSFFLPEMNKTSGSFSGIDKIANWIYQTFSYINILNLHSAHYMYLYIYTKFMLMRSVSWHEGWIEWPVYSGP